MDPTPSLLVAQVSDLHLFAETHQDLLGWNTWDSLQAVVEALEAAPRRPDVLLLTGDLAQDETEKAYRNLMGILRPLNIPTFWVPGNHDHIPSMKQILHHPPIYRDKVTEQGGWKFLLLNSQITGHVHGAISARSLAWLEQQLQACPSEQPVLIAMHHPPFAVGSPWLDRSGLQNSEALLQLLENYSQVKLVIFGHVHQVAEWKRQHITYLSSPSTCIQFMPHSNNFALGYEQPGFRFLHLYPNGQFHTEVQRVAFQQQLNFAAQGY